MKKGTIVRAASFLLLVCWTFNPVECDILLTITHVSPTIILTSWRISGVITGEDIVIFLDPPHGGNFPVRADKTETEFRFSGLFPATSYTITVSAFINGRNSTSVVTRSTTRNPCDNNPCENGGACQLVIGLYTAYSCYCSECFSGEHCEYGPTMCESNPCQNGGTCKMKEGSCTEYECTCPDCYSGYSCEIDNNACHSDPCPVLEGYNTTCQPIGALCDDYQCFCENTERGCFVGKQCQTVHNPCQPNPCVHGVCLPDETSCGHICDCPGCYTGEACEILLNPCASNPCEHGECIRDDRSCYQYTCVCDDCYTGKLCDQYFEDPCSFYSPCRNNATCQPVAESCMEYECLCPECYEGKVCQKYHNPCESTPCANGGTCTPLEGTCTLFNCSCPICFTGDQCDISMDACQSFPCKNGGTCTPTNECLEYSCQCSTWWIGPNCSWSLVSILIAGQVLFVAILVAINITVVCIRRRRKRKRKLKQLRRKSRRMTMRAYANNGFSSDISSNGTGPRTRTITENGSKENVTTVPVGDLSSSDDDDDDDSKEGKEQDEFTKDLSNVAHEFCDNTTWHGLPNIGRSRTSASRLLWAVVVVAACIAFIVQASVMVFRFYSRKTNIDMEETSVSFLKFPAVTICNTNKVRASALLDSNHYAFVNMMLNIKVQAYYVPCLPGDSLCNDGIHCVKAYLVCDGMRNCPDGSDEFGCDFTSYVCGADQFKCSKGGLSGVCIPGERKCDGIEDCNESEDEKNCNIPGRECDGFFCDVNFCHPYTDKCNYKIDCRDGSDEEGCKYRLCQEWEFTCENRKCVQIEKLCDWIDDCGDGSDERDCEYALCGRDEFKCTNGKCIKSWKVCNNYNDCPDGSDELQNCTSLLCSDSNVNCEFWAENGECAQNPAYMKKYCPLSCRICEGENVVPDDTGNCPRGFFKCNDEMCIDDILVCDIVGECPNSEDEKWPNCIYQDFGNNDEVFEEGWWQKFSAITDNQELFENFMKYYYKDPGFDRVRREDPPDWNGFITFSSTPDFSDLKHVLQLSAEEIQEYGHQAEDFILQCSYNERPCDHSHFKPFQDKVYGNCYTFNHGTDGDVIRNATKSGAQYGLKLTLFTEQHEYLGIYGQESGVRVSIHNPQHMPMPADNGLTAKTGAATSFAIRQNTYERKGPPYGRCTKTNDPIFEGLHFRYSTLACKHMCLQERMQEYCGCMDVPFYGGGNCKILDKRQEACRQLIHYFQQNQVLPCDCYPPCEEDGFSKTTSLASWPSESYLRQLLKSIYAINPKTKILSDAESAQKNLAYIEVYFDSLSVQYIRENVAYTDDDLMSDMGGLLGLYIGVSVITICELCVFIKSLIVLLVGRIQNSFFKRRTDRSDSYNTQQANPDGDSSVTDMPDAHRGGVSSTAEME